MTLLEAPYYHEKYTNLMFLSAQLVINITFVNKMVLMWPAQPYGKKKRNFNCYVSNTLVLLFFKQRRWVDEQLSHPKQIQHTYINENKAYRFGNSLNVKKIATTGVSYTNRLFVIV